MSLLQSTHTHGLKFIVSLATELAREALWPSLKARPLAIHDTTKIGKYTTSSALEYRISNSRFLRSYTFFRVSKKPNRYASTNSTELRDIENNNTAFMTSGL